MRPPGTTSVSRAPIRSPRRRPSPSEEGGGGGGGSSPPGCGPRGSGGSVGRHGVGAGGPGVGGRGSSSGSGGSGGPAAAAASKPWIRKTISSNAASRPPCSPSSCSAPDSAAHSSCDASLPSSSGAGGAGGARAPPRLPRPARPLARPRPRAARSGLARLGTGQNCVARGAPGNRRMGTMFG